ncbi:hypothetical protein [Rhodoferax sp. GW822-FHT02A01]|uniref:hypothetical protein n=1 Tax=Rhodoferax sp. GW822-FHT02A01 TaxID=3141537 RepID=UPI00315D5E13
MFKDEITQPTYSGIDRDAYNAAFYEIGLNWYWDEKIYADLTCQFDSPAEQIQHYLNAQHPHLLRVYDATFLTDLIQSKMAEYCTRASSPSKQFSRNYQRRHVSTHQIGF